MPSRIPRPRPVVALASAESARYRRRAVPRPSRITLIFALAFAAVIIGPPELGRGQFGAVWAEAQGMHLAANSIDNLVAGQTAAPAVPLIHMFDEIVSHYLWLLAIVGLAALAYVRERRHPLL